MPTRRRSLELAPLPFISATLTALALGGCAHAPYTDRAQLITVFEKDEIALSADIYSEILRKAPISDDPRLNSALREVGERIAAVADRPDYQWEFAVIENDAANAFALPGGKVAVYSGLFPLAHDTAGLAAVLGHEVAHAIARHSAERLSQERLISALSHGAASAVPIPGLDLLAAFALGMGVHVGYELPFSRAQELEADHIGILLMARAGYDPSQALALWDRFEAAQQHKPIEFLSTHPNPGTRRQDLGALLPKAQAYFEPTTAAPLRNIEPLPSDATLHPLASAIEGPTPPIAAPKQQEPAPSAPVPPPPSPQAAAATPKPPEPSPGRGGQEHTYLQTLIKRLAEDRGYRAAVEHSILGGAGSVDVALEKGEQRIACEICVTTTTDQELANIQKCLSGGYGTVIVVARDAKTLRAIQTAAETTLTAETLSQVRFLSPEDFVAYLEEVAATEAGSEGSVRGYKVKVNYKPVNEADAKARREALSKILLERAKPGRKKPDS